MSNIAEKCDAIAKLSPNGLKMAMYYDRASPKIQRAINVCLGVLERETDADDIQAIIDQLARHEITGAEAVDKLESLPGADA